jgi:hypothetical protein
MILIKIKEEFFDRYISSLISEGFFKPGTKSNQHIEVEESTAHPDHWVIKGSHYFIPKEDCVVFDGGINPVEKKLDEAKFIEGWYVLNNESPELLDALKILGCPVTENSSGCFIKNGNMIGWSGIIDAHKTGLMKSKKQLFTIDIVNLAEKELRTQKNKKFADQLNKNKEEFLVEDFAVTIDRDMTPTKITFKCSEEFRVNIKDQLEKLINECRSNQKDFENSPVECAPPPSGIECLWGLLQQGQITPIQYAKLSPAVQKYWAPYIIEFIDKVDEKHDADTLVGVKETDNGEKLRFSKNKCVKIEGISGLYQALIKLGCPPSQMKKYGMGGYYCFYANGIVHATNIIVPERFDFLSAEQVIKMAEEEIHKRYPLTMEECIKTSDNNNLVGVKEAWKSAKGKAYPYLTNEELDDLYEIQLWKDKKPVLKHVIHDEFPTDHEVRQWIKDNEELFGFDQNTKLTLLAFMWWIKSR